MVALEAQVVISVTAVPWGVVLFLLSVLCPGLTCGESVCVCMCV